MTAGPSRRRGRADRGGATARRNPAARGGASTRRGGTTRGRVGSPRSFQLLKPARAGGLLGLLLAGLVLRLVTSSTAFGLDRIDTPSLHWTAPDAVLAAVGVPLGSNVFAIETGPIEARLEALPAIANATVRVGLPTALEVEVVERDPILAWRVGDTTFLVDADGVLFATVSATELAPIGIPAVIDDRVASPFTLAVGGALDAIDFDVATRLGSLVPADIGSAATRLAVHVDDTDGFVLRGAGEAWKAVFGIYTANVRPPSLIAGQVQLLRSLLAGREEQLARIVLADATNGTYTLRATPKP